MVCWCFDSTWGVRGSLLRAQVYLKRGLPRLRPFSLAALRDWGAPLAGTSDFQYLLYSLLLQQSKPLALVRTPCSLCFPASPSLLGCCERCFLCLPLSW